MLAALRTWPSRGVPERPVAWLAVVARNRMIDAIRQESRFADNEPEESVADLRDNPRSGQGVDRKDLLVAICETDLSVPNAVTLSLKSVFGFGIREIALLLGVERKAVELRLYRARTRLRASGSSVGEGTSCGGRCREAVMHVLYAAFTDGFARPLEPSPITVDLVTECISIAEALLAETHWRTPTMHALTALFYLQGSRVDARHNSGVFVPLHEQDRSLWRSDWISSGLKHFDTAMAGTSESRYHIEAAIAASYATAVAGDDPPWTQIVDLYDRLISAFPTPAARISHAIALGLAGPPERGLAALEHLESEHGSRLRLHQTAAEAEFLQRCGRRAESLDRFKEAHEQARTDSERAYLDRRIQDLQDQL